MGVRGVVIDRWLAGGVRLVIAVCVVMALALLASLAIVLVMGLIWLGASVVRAEELPCETYRITGYVRGAHSPQTFDGTSVWTREPVAAASWNLPIGSLVNVDGLGTYRVADRGGGLGNRHIDVLVDSRDDAYALTGWRPVCVVRWGYGAGESQ